MLNYIGTLANLTNEILMKVLFSLIFVLLLFNCTPEYTFEDEGDIQNDSLPKEFAITTLDTTIGGFHLPLVRSLDLDLDGDSIIDITFESQKDLSPGGSYKVASIMHVKNGNLKFPMQELSDTLKHCWYKNASNDSIIYDQWYNSMSGWTKKNIITDEVLSIETITTIKNYPDTDSLFSAYYMHIVKCILSSKWGDASIWHWEGGVYIGTSYWDYVRDPFKNKVIFIYYKMEGEQEDKYGWIKLSIQDSNEITIFETAFEK